MEGAFGNTSPFKPLVESFIGFKASMEKESKLMDLKFQAKCNQLKAQEDHHNRVENSHEAEFEFMKRSMAEEAKAEKRMLQHQIVALKSQVVALKSKMRGQKRKLDELVRDNLELSSEALVRPAPWVIEHGARIS